MSRDSLEWSQQDSSPVEFYSFGRGSDLWRYTNAPKDITWGGFLWSARAITRSNATCANTIPKDTIEVNLPYDDALVQSVASGMTYAPTTITIVRSQMAALEEGGRFFFKGRIAKVGRDQQISTLTCEPVFSSLARFGIYQPYQRMCRHVFGGNGCFVNLAALTTNVSVVTVSGANVGIMVLSPPNYVGGTLKAADGSQRTVIAQSGATLTLMRPISSIAPGDHVDVCIGCDRSLHTCNTTHNNAGNFGGWAGIPLINPFTVTRSVFI